MIQMIIGPKTEVGENVIMRNLIICTDSTVAVRSKT
jgi:hypothetical protein